MFKKSLSMFLALCMMCTITIVFSIRVLADIDANVFSDDFESYSVTEGTVSGGNQSVAENWVISNVYKGWNGDGKAAIIQNSDAGSKELMISGCGNNSDPANAVCVNYVGDTSAVVGDARIQAELRGSGDGEIGIRFMVSTDENSYYEMRSQFWGGPMNVTKAINGERTTLGTVESGWGFNSGLKRTLSLSLGGNTLTATVVKEVENGPAETYTNSFTDETPLRADGNNTKCQLVVAGDNTTAYFDNFSYKAVDTYVDLKKEPDNVMYLNVSRNRRVHAADNAATINFANDGDAGTVYTGKLYEMDLGKAYRIRRIDLAGVTASDAINIYVSDDASAWTDLHTVETASISNSAYTYVNHSTNVPFRYIKFSSDVNFEMGEITVLTDVDTLTTEVRLNSKLYFLPRIGGADASDAGWTYSSEGFGIVEGGVFIPTNLSPDGAITINAAKDEKTVSASVNILPGYSIVRNTDGTVRIDMGFAVRTPDAEFFAAYYGNDDRLVKISAIGFGFGKNSNLDDISLDLTPAAEYDYAKIYYWKGGLTELHPVMDAIEFQKNSAE